MLQIVIQIILQFALYRYVIVSLGISEFGIWSLVLSTISATRIADLGFTVGVVFFVSKDLSQGMYDHASEVIDTASIILFVGLGLILTILFPVLSILYKTLFGPSDLSVALAILPYSLITLWFTIMSSLFQSGLDGCQRMDVRSILVLLGQFVLFIATMALVPDYGLMGLAWAQVIQGIVTLLIGRAFLRKEISCLAFIPTRFNKSTAKQLLRYGLNMQIGSLFMLFLDPLIKMIMTKYGGPTSVGYFDAANQVILRARGILSSLNQVVSPKVTELNIKEPHLLASLIEKNYRLIVFAVIMFAFVIFVFASQLSIITIGSSNDLFIYFLKVLFIGWMLNILSMPAYYFAIGTGMVTLITASHVTLTIMSLLMAWLLGDVIGANGVVFGYSAGIGLGGLVLVIMFHWGSGNSMHFLVSKDDLALLVGGLLIYSIDKLLYNLGQLQAQFMGNITLLQIIQSLLMLTLIWLHPERKYLTSLFKK